MFLFFGLLGCSAPTTSSPIAWSGICCCCLATACGLLATAVLNINNVRATSRPMPPAARSPWRCAWPQPRHRLSLGLAGAALLATIAFLLTQPASLWPWIFLPAMKPPHRCRPHPCESFDGEVLTGALKKTAISAFLFSLLLSIGLALT